MLRFSQQVLVAPLIEPLSLVEAKAWLRVDTPSEDDLIAALITAARLVIEAETRLLLITQSWRLTLDRWPEHRSFELPLTPCQAVLGVRTVDFGGVSNVIPTSAYALATNPQSAQLHFTDVLPVDRTVCARLEIDLQVGYGDAATSVPEPLRQAIRLLVARWFENRGDVTADTSGGHLSGPVAALIAPYRRLRV